MILKAADPTKHSTVTDQVHYNICASNVVPGAVVKDNLGRLLMKLGDHNSPHTVDRENNQKSLFVHLDPNDFKVFYIEPEALLTHYGHAHIKITTM